MIAFGLRLAVATGREALTRLATIAAAVTLGVGLLLVVLAGINAVNAQTGRYAWLDTGSSDVVTPAGTGDPLWWAARYDYYGGKEIGRIDVAATGPHSPVPPGIPRLPGPGEYYASAKLSALLASTPADQLADRYPGHLIGTLGRAAVPDPSILLIVVGHTPDEMAGMAHAQRVTAISTTVPTTQLQALDLVLGVVAAALLFPVLVFIGAATRMSAARREQRFAAMRLVGATPRQISTLAAVESTVASVIGTAIGFGLFLLFQRPLSAVPFTGTAFYPEDLALNAADVVLVAIGVPVAAATAARLALRRVRISPLGVARRVTPRSPRWYRLIPVAAGVVELAYFVGRRPQSTNGQVAAYLSGILLIMAGLVYAGPWLTMVGARALARRSRRPATLIAARRLADDPRSAFRAISGLVLALFVTTVASAVISTIVAHRGGEPASSAASTVLSANFIADTGTAVPSTVPPSLLSDLRAIPGVADALVVRSNPAGRDADPPGLIPCADLDRVGTLGHCPAGASVASVWWDVVGPDPAYGGTWRGPTSTVWPAASIPVADVAHLPVLSVVAATDGSTTALERARTLLEIAFPGRRQAPATERDHGLGAAQTLAGWEQLAAVVIIASVPVAGCSLAINVISGLSERKRPFSLLRLTGAPLRMLRRVVALESAVPLLVAAAIAIGVGFVAAQLFLEAQLGYRVQAPGLGYYLAVAAGLAASLAVIGGALPLLRRMTGPETARNECRSPPGPVSRSGRRPSCLCRVQARPRRARTSCSRSARMSSSSAMERRSSSMSQWVRGGLAFFCSGSLPSTRRATVPSNLHSHVIGTSASTANGTSNWWPRAQRYSRVCRGASSVFRSDS